MDTRVMHERLVGADSAKVGSMLAHLPTSVTGNGRPRENAAWEGVRSTTVLWNDRGCA